MKKIFTILCAFLVIISTNQSANTINAFDEIDISQYEITKQYDLSELNFQLQENSIVNINSMNSTMNLFNVDHNNQINNEINQIVTNILLENENVRMEAIGRTTVYFNRIENDETINYLPITEEEYYNTNPEYSTFATGSTTNKGSLSLYTVAYYDENDYLYGRSVAIWNSNTGAALSSNYPSTDDDFIGLTLPSNYTITSHFADETNDLNRVTAYAHDDEYS